MIKYSRGLLKNGKLPLLFYLQYLLINFVFYSQWLLMLYSQFYRFEEQMLETFQLERDPKKVFEISIFRYFSTSMCIFLIVIMIMSFGVFYLKRRSKRHCHYRQNVFTFKSTLFWGLLHFVIFISLYVTFTSGKVQIFSVIRILMIFSHFIKSIVTIFENQTNLPELFTNLKTNNRSSSSNVTTFYPRQENFLPNLPFKQNARWV